MQTLRRHNPTHIQDDHWQATEPVDLGTTQGCSCLRRVDDVERQIIGALNAAREAVTRCEHALELVVEARKRQTIGQLRPHPARPDCRMTAPDYPARLTNREVEVLRLIAAGDSNRQIADALYLSPRTIERHIANIYLKIDAHNKTEATAYARRHNLT